MAMNIVLLQPEIPQNTGNIARTCACTGAVLHLVEPMGFRLTQRNIQRSGLDYWDKVEIKRYATTEQFFQQHAGERFFLFTGRTDKSYADVQYQDGDYLIFGRESTGIDEEVLEQYADSCVRIPMRETLRSLNLSNSVAIGLYEALRQQGYPNML